MPFPILDENNNYVDPEEGAAWERRVQEAREAEAREYARIEKAGRRRARQELGYGNYDSDGSDGSDIDDASAEDDDHVEEVAHSDGNASDNDDENGSVNSAESEDGDVVDGHGSDGSDPDDDDENASTDDDENDSDHDNENGSTNDDENASTDEDEDASTSSEDSTQSSPSPPIIINGFTEAQARAVRTAMTQLIQSDWRSDLLQHRDYDLDSGPLSFYTSPYHANGYTIMGFPATTQLTNTTNNDVSVEMETPFQQAQRAQRELDRQEAEFLALPLHRVVRKSTENSLLSTVDGCEGVDGGEMCSICQGCLCESPDSEMNNAVKSPEPGQASSSPAPPTTQEPSTQGSLNRVSKLNCGCKSKFHFECIMHWLENPHGDSMFRVASCPNCREKFRIEWIGGDAGVGGAVVTGDGSVVALGGGAELEDEYVLFNN